jgi:hypothetical protein
MSILAETALSGDTNESLRSERYLEVTAGISLTTIRKTLFISEDLPFVVELFLTGRAFDYDEYFEFSAQSYSPDTTYEVYNAITGEKIEIDLNDPLYDEVREQIEACLKEKAENALDNEVGDGKSPDSKQKA